MHIDGSGADNQIRDRIRSAATISLPAAPAFRSADPPPTRIRVPAFRIVPAWTIRPMFHSCSGRPSRVSDRHRAVANFDMRHARLRAADLDIHVVAGRAALLATCSWPACRDSRRSARECSRRRKTCSTARHADQSPTAPITPSRHALPTRHSVHRSCSGSSRLIGIVTLSLGQRSEPMATIRFIS